MLKRKDGRLYKEADPMFKVMPIIMKHRSDSQVFFSIDVPINQIDEYLKEKQAQGVNLSYLHIVYSALVRTIAEREKLNYFINNSKIYQRYGIYLSMTIKKSFSDEAQETNIKIKFNGNETPEEIKEKLQKEIDDFKKSEGENGQDKFLRVMNKLPFWILKSGVKILMKMDKWNMLPKKIIDISPFHSTAYITNVGSIGLDSIYHHIYNFGTIGVFVAMGRKKREMEENEMKKYIPFSFVLDERICDGYYFSKSLQLLLKYLKNPKLLENEEEQKEQK